jgi:Asp/Glu/hydantoin racemase
MPSMPTANGGPSTRPTSAKSPFSTPITSPPRNRPHQVLLINPNSTRSMTEAMLHSLRPNVPPNVELTGYTAPYPAPTAIESTTDAIMSTEAVLRDLAKHAAPNGETVQNYDGMIVACFSRHPLIDALRESYDVPVIGIMEASVYVARMLGGRFGIVATAQRSRIKQDDDIAAYGMTHFYVGSEATHLGVLELDSRPKEEVAKRVAHCARALVMKGADTILLGCAGMTDMIRAAKDAVRDEDGRRTVNVVDSVEAGVMMMNSLIGMGIPTSKKGLYKGEKEARRTRGQNWL